VHAHTKQSIEKYHLTGGTDIILTAFIHQDFMHTRGRIIILYILSFVFLDSMQENKRC